MSESIMRVLAIILSLLSGSLATATEPATDVDQQRFTGRLSNGLQILIEPHHDWPVTCVQLWFRGGSRLDPPELSGRSRRTLAGLVRSGFDQRSFEAEESLRLELYRDAHGVLLISLPQHVSEDVRLLARMLLNSNIPAAAHELLIDAEDHDISADVWRASVRALLGEHPDAIDPLAMTEAARQLDSQALAKMADKWFTPGHALLVVAGRCDVKAMHAVISEAWSEHAWQPERRLAQHAMPEREKLADIEAEIPGLALAWSTSGLGAFENVYLDALMDHLALELNQADDGLELRWRRESWGDGGLVVLYLSMSETEPTVRLEQSAKRVLAEIESIASQPPEPLRFLRAAGIARRRYLTSIDNNADEIALRARGYLNDGNWQLVDDDRARLADPHVEPLQIAARRLLRARFVRIIGTSAVMEQNSSPANADEIASVPDFPAIDIRLETPIPSVALRVIDAPGAELATVITLVPIQDENPANRLDLNQLPFADALQEYLDIHAATLEPVQRLNPPAIGLRARVPAERIDSLIEWSARVLQAQASADLQHAEKIEIQVHGEVEAAVIRRAIQLAWPDAPTNIP
jgi:hypothetical protein